jgi:hypothetical protein
MGDVNGIRGSALVCRAMACTYVSRLTSCTNQTRTVLYTHTLRKIMYDAALCWHGCFRARLPAWLPVVPDDERSRPS